MAKSGRRRVWAKATDDTDIFPAVDDEDPAEPSPTEEDDEPGESERSHGDAHENNKHQRAMPKRPVEQTHVPEAKAFE